jgi:tetratricopeptide (TPR) repeat protein
VFDAMILPLFIPRYRAAFCALALLWSLHSRAATVDALSPALQGEFALQSGDGASAARKYLEAAQKTDDPALAQRATEVALLAHENELATRALARWRLLDPTSNDLASADAVLALRTGDRATARRDLLAMLGAHGDGWKQVLRVLASATDSATSARVVGDLLEQGHWPQDIPAWLALGALSQRLGDPALTRRIVGDVVRRFPNEPHVWLLESERLREEGDSIAARRAVDHALALDAGDATVRSAAAAELALLNDRQAAAAALAKGPQDDASYIARAAYLAEADDSNGLAKLYAEVSAPQKSALTPAPDAARRLLLGQLAEYLKHDDEALAWYRGVPSGAQHDEAQNRIAIVLDTRGDLDGALHTLRDLQHDDGADGDAQRDSFQIEAELLAKHQRKDEALATYGRGLAIFDGEPGLLYGRALLLEGMDRVGEAESDLRNIVEMQPDNAEALNALGYTLADRTQRYAEAQVLIERALRLQPDSPAILDSLGWVQHRLGRDAEALRNLRRAFALQKDAEIAAHLGEVLWLGGDKDAARGVWKQGLAIDKDNRAIQRVVQTYHP